MFFARLTLCLTATKLCTFSQINKKYALMVGITTNFAIFASGYVRSPPSGGQVKVL